MPVRGKGWVLALLIAALAMPSVAFAAASDIAGEWACVAVDSGDGVKQVEYEGIDVAELVKIAFREDGTLTMTSQGEDTEGTWAEADSGVNALIDGQDVAFKLVDGQLVNDTDGVLIYLEKAVKKKGGLLGALGIGKYTGKWVATGFDKGDGLIVDEMDGYPVSEYASLQIKRDGTLVMTSLGEDTAGTWAETDVGIDITVNDQTAGAVLEGGILILEADGQKAYLEREGKVTVTPSPKLEATPEPAPEPEPEASAFAGEWSAVRYETGGYWYDAKLLFPDGCKLVLNGDGTGSAKITADYTEKLTWSEADGLLVLSGSYIFSDPNWDAESGALRLNYGSSEVAVVFVKGEAPEDQDPAEYGLIEEQATAQPEVTPEPEEPEESAAPDVTLEPEETAAPEQGAAEQAFTAPLFSATFPAGWVSNEYSLSTDEGYSSVKYEKRDESDTTLCSVWIYASSEGVDSYRSAIKRLTEYAEKAGEDALEEITIGGIAFRGTAYENWGWKYREYAARVPESKISAYAVIEQPENAGDELQGILDSVSFTLPQLETPNVDPPMPEDGVPYEPTPGSVKAGKFTLKADWIAQGKSIVLDSIFGNQIAKAGDELYVLAGKKLYAYGLNGNKLKPSKAFEGGALKLNDSFEALSAGSDGILYASQGVFNVLAFKKGKQVADNSISGNVVIHPGGTWGISSWANADTVRVTAKDGVLTGEPWVLTNLSDPEKRTGRFSSVSCMAISEKRIYVAGYDAENADAQRIAVYDLKGVELFSFGGLDWMQDDAFGSVSGIVETKNGILVQDGNNRAYKLFSKDGAFIASVSADELLGTSYPWLSSMISTKDGILVAAAQKREDQSCDELLIFRISGF